MTRTAFRKINNTKTTTMKKLLTIGEAAKALGVTTTTLRNWDKKGLLKPDEITRGGARRYSMDSLMGLRTYMRTTPDNLKTIAYARVAKRELKAELNSQTDILIDYCSSHGFDYELIEDIGSGVNFYKKGLSRLLEMILGGKASRLVLTRRNNLLRIGSEFIFSICEAMGVEIIIINSKNEVVSKDDDLSLDVKDVLEILSSRIDEMKNPQSKELLGQLGQVLDKNA